MVHESNDRRSPSFQVIVCERDGRWARAMRRELAGVRVRECRHWDDARESLAEGPASLVVLELTPGTAALVVDAITTIGRAFPRASVIVAAARSCDAWEWLVREAGAVHFVNSPRALGELRGMVARQMRRLPPDTSTLSDRVWRRLPWRPIAS